MHCVILFLDSHIPPRWHFIDRHQHHFSLLICHPCRPNNCGNVSCGTHIPLHWAFRIIDAIVSLHIWVNMCRTILFAVIWIIQVTILVWQIFIVQNAFRCTILITFDWMTVESTHTAGIQNLSSSSREVLWRQSWCQRWSIRQSECSRTIVFKLLPQCIDDLSGIWDVSYCSHLLVLKARFRL